MISSFLSWCLGLIDLGYCLVVRAPFLGKRLPKFFSLGWGDYNLAIKSMEHLYDRLRHHHEQDSSSGSGVNSNKYFYNIQHQIEWDEPQASINNDTIVLQKGKFPSPIAAQLPKVAQDCQFLFVQSQQHKQKQDNDSEERVVVIMLPATGEASSKPRLAMAKELAIQRGWSSVIVTAPYYGARKPSNQKKWFITTVQDFLLQSQAIIEETAALACYFSSKDPKNTKICITGFSWGAAMTCCASTVALLAGCPGPKMACVPYVGSATPAVLTDGLLSASVDWEALALSMDDDRNNNNNNNMKEPLNTVFAAHDKLNSILKNVQLREISQILVARRQQLLAKDTNDTSADNLSLGALQVLSMQHDHIIRKSWSNDLILELDNLSNLRTAKLPPQWLPGGHVVGALAKHRVQTRAIVDAVTALTV